MKIIQQQRCLKDPACHERRKRHPTTDPNSYPPTLQAQI